MSGKAQLTFIRLKQRVERRRKRVYIPMVILGLTGWLYAMFVMDAFNGLAIVSLAVMGFSSIMLLVDLMRMDNAEAVLNQESEERDFPDLLN